MSTTFSGLGNYSTKSATLSVPSVSLGSFSFRDFSTTVDMERGDVISQIQTRYTGLETVTRILVGRHISYFPNFDTAEDTIQCWASFSGSTLTLTVRVNNTTSVTRSTRSFTFDATIFLFTAPFAG